MNIEKQTMPLLLVDDNLARADQLKEIFSDEFSVQHVSNIAMARDRLVESKPRVILCSVDAEAVDGVQFCREIKASTDWELMPVVLFSSSSAENTLERAFLAGADDFVDFSYGLGFAKVRVKAKASKAKLNSHPPLVLGNIKLSFDTRSVSVDEKVYSLSRLETRLLGYFLGNLNKVVSREVLLSEVWHDLTVTQRVVDTHLVTIRRKLKGASIKIDSIYKMGYVARVVTG